MSPPNLVGGRHAELSIKHVRDIRPLHGRLFIGMGARLFADQVYLAHQLTYLESPDLHAVLFHHQHDAPAARSASALRKQLIHAAAQNHPFGIWIPTFPAVRVVARSGYFKYGAQQINRLLSPKLID
jgi:hypothetical protein